MGVLAAKCCKYNKNDETLANLEGQEDKNNKLIEQRNLYLEEEEKVYEHIEFEDTQQIHPKDNFSGDEIITNISFENSENHFVIEDCFYKIPHKLAKTVSEVKFPEDFNEIKKQIFSNIVTELIDGLKEKINRIDGILIPGSKHVIILTEFEVMEFRLIQNKLELKSKFSFNEVDYFSLTRDGRKLIFHLIENKTFVINHEKLDKVAACLCSSYFYDKSNFSSKGKGGRQISVIVMNENFPIISQLERISDFNDYHQLLNKFLESKLREIKLDFENTDFKYASVKYKKELNFVTGDLIISMSSVYLLEFNLGFKIIHEIPLDNLAKIIPNKRKNSLRLFDFENFKEEGLEIRTESYASILTLLDDLVRLRKNSK